MLMAAAYRSEYGVSYEIITFLKERKREGGREGEREQESKASHISNLFRMDGMQRQ